jgi:hypothetical protein
VTATSTLTKPALAPTGNPAPVEMAVVDGIAANFGPETFLWINFRRPNNSVRIRYAWTAGGQPLGDRIDQIAMAAGYDAADWLHIADRHEQTTTRGRVEIKAYPLRPVLADVQSGERGPHERRERLRRLIHLATGATGQTPDTSIPRWLGFGPALTARAD